MSGNRAAAAVMRLSENVYLSAVRAGMMAVVPLTIVGGIFMVVVYLPVPGWELRVACFCWAWE